MLRRPRNCPYNKDNMAIKGLPRSNISKTNSGRLGSMMGSKVVL
jgi:hypothetical protein